MIQVMAVMIAAMVTFPFVTTFISYQIMKIVYRSKKRALHASVAYTTIFYIISVMMMLEQLFNTTYFGIIIIIILAGFMVSIIIQWRLTEDIVIKHAWKIFWRVIFLVFLFTHFTLGMVGIIHTI